MQFTKCIAAHTILGFTYNGDSFRTISATATTLIIAYKSLYVKEKKFLSSVTCHSYWGSVLLEQSQKM